jgi:hypothetical protein
VTQGTEQCPTGRSQHLQEDCDLTDGIEGSAPGLLQPEKDRVGLRPRGAPAAVDLADILDQPGMALVDAGDGDGMARLLRAARDFFQEPRPQRVDFENTGEIDTKTLRALKLRCDRAEQAFQHIGIDHRPRSGGTELKRVADRGDIEKWRGTHCCSP